MSMSNTTKLFLIYAPLTFLGIFILSIMMSIAGFGDYIHFPLAIMVYGLILDLVVLVLLGIRRLLGFLPKKKHEPTRPEPMDLPFLESRYKSRIAMVVITLIDLIVLLYSFMFAGLASYGLQGKVSSPGDFLNIGVMMFPFAVIVIIVWGWVSFKKAKEHYKKPLLIISAPLLFLIGVGLLFYVIAIPVTFIAYLFGYEV